MPTNDEAIIDRYSLALYSVLMGNCADTSTIDSYTAAQAARLAGLTMAMLNYLSRYGVAIASGGGKRGRGNVRRYVFADVLMLRVLSKLLANGISVLRLRKSLQGIRDRGTATEILVRKFVVTDGYNIYFQDAGVTELLETGQLAFAFVLELNAIRKEVVLEIEHAKVA